MGSRVIFPSRETYKWRERTAPGGEKGKVESSITPKKIYFEK
jgi:hypothetical protein